MKRSAFGVKVKRSAFGVKRSAFGVKRSAFGVKRSAFGVKRSSVLNACCFQLRQLWVISSSITPNAALCFVHAFICSRIDCCSAIYAGLPLGSIAA